MAERSQDDAMMTVDVAIPARVMNAARARVTLIRENEKTTVGAAWTHLADVARASLIAWPLKDRPPIPKGQQRTRTTVRITDDCPHCGREVLVNANAMLRKHPATGVPCPPVRSHKREPAEPPDTIPLRFPMPVARYEEIKSAITSRGYTVVRVLTEQLIAFARTGQY